MAQKRITKAQKINHIRLGKLQTMPEVAKFQARMIKKALKEGGVTINDGYKLVMMASMLAKTLEATNLEKRIAALEEKYTHIIG
jgi:hypothetical protein